MKEVCFIYIITPKTRKKLFLDNSITDYEERLKEVKKILDYNNGEIREYCLENNTIKSQKQMSSYYTAERILDTLATYLLRGQYKENGIMTTFDIRNAKIKEIPISNVTGNAFDLLYSVGSDSERKNKIVNATTELIAYGKPDKRIKKKSKNNKLNKIYSTKEVSTYTEKTMTDEFGNTYTDIVHKKIGGHKGIIDLNENYIAKWAYVDTNNEFEFNGRKFKISNDLKTYLYNKETHSYPMDKVLCYFIPSSTKYYFFDENIDQINEKYITEVG